MQCVHKFASLLKKKGGLKIKETVMIKPETRRTNFFRGEDLINAITATQPEIEKIFKVFCIDISSKEKINDFLSK